MSEPVGIETRISRNTNDIEALYGLIEEFAGRTRVSFAKVNQRLDDLEGRFDGLEGKVDSIAGQLGEVLELLRKQS
ncbi:MAG: hypothetical protein ACRDRX_08090 [Pseudonocardiaceae bacterium]